MLKNLFKSAKKALKNPIVQLGIGALLPQSAMFQSLAKAAPILSNPAVLQGGIGLLAGDKPIDIARNIGIQSLLGGFRGLGEGGPGFTEGMKRTFQTQTEKQRLIDEIEDAIPDIKKTKDSVVDKVFLIQLQFLILGLHCSSFYINYLLQFFQLLWLSL